MIRVVSPTRATDAESLTSLVERAREGSSAAWTIIVKRLERVVWKTTYSYDLSPADREDVFQNTWWRLYTSLAKIEDPERLPGWLATTAGREALDVKKRRNRTIPVDDFRDLSDRSSISPEESVLDAELRSAVRAAFERLEPHCQRLLRLLTLVHDEMSYQEVAALIETSVGSIGPTRGRCLDKLRAMPELARLLPRR